jgi:hypothetical protein
LEEQKEFINLWKQITKIKRIQSKGITTKQEQNNKATPHFEDHMPLGPNREITNTQDWLDANQNLNPPSKERP